MRDWPTKRRTGAGTPTSLVTTVLAIAFTGGLILQFAPGAEARVAVQATTAVCQTPEVVTAASAGQPLIETDASPVASPVSSTSSTPIASPVAEPVTSTAADVTISGQIEQTLRSIAVCQSERRVKSLTRFVTEDFLSDVYAGGGKISKEQFILLGRDLPRVPVEILDVSNVTIDSTGAATADVSWTVSNQLFNATWSFVFVGQENGDDTGDDDPSGYWMADGLEPQSIVVPENATEVSLKLGKIRYVPSSLSVEGPDIVIAAKNTAPLDHEMLVLRLDAGVTTSTLLTAPGAALPKGVTFIGQVTVPGDDEAKLVLVGVDPGTYVIVDLLPDENGTPHLALGMEATLIVR